MKTRVITAIGALLLTTGMWFAYRARFKPNPPAPAGERAAHPSPQRIKMDNKAIAMVTEWKRGPMVPINSDELRGHLASIRSEGCLRAPFGARTLTFDELAESQVRDLQSAIGDLLIAYASGEPIAFFNSMRDRGTTLSPAVREKMMSFLKRKGTAALETASDDAVFASQWKALSAGAHWRDFVVDSTCLQVWDGQNLEREEISRITWDRNRDPSSPGALLDDAMQSSTIKTTSFVPDAGSIDAELASKQGVLLADLKLIIGYDATLHELKAANLCRFWFNREQQKWQPICLVIFGTSPGPKYLPIVLF